MTMNKFKYEKTNILRRFRRISEYWTLITGFCLFVAIGWWLTTYTQLLEVTSESLEGVHYLLVRKSTSINQGDIVAIQGHKPQYLKGSYIFTKRAIGLPGDQIIKSQNSLTIKTKNGSFTITYPLLNKTKEGQILTPLSISAVPGGYLFVVGDHLRSFDSRYEEFGLVSIDNIYGKAILKW